MPGTILSSATRKRIAECHIKAAQYVIDRKGLIELYQAARLSLQKGTYFDEVTKALIIRASELGVNRKDGEQDA